MSLRDYYVISYAEYLHSDPGLWRLTVDYLYTCSEIGKEMADEILIRVPLDFNNGRKSMTDGYEADRSLMEVEEDLKSSNLSAIVKELNATCYEYQREHTRRSICQARSQYCLLDFMWTLINRSRLLLENSRNSKNMAWQFPSAGQPKIGRCSDISLRMSWKTLSFGVCS